MTRRRRMTLRHIEAFRAVSITGSMTEAAAQIHTSQPQISRLISQLEEITEFSLFKRNGSRLTPTVEGVRFFKDVEQSFAGLDALKTAAGRIRAFSASQLSVSAMPRLAGGMLTRAVARFKQEFPDVMVSLHSSDAASIQSWVSSGLCDVGLAMLYADAPGVTFRKIATLECVAIFPPQHRLAGRKSIHPQDLDGEPFISLPSTSPLRNRIDSIFSAADSRPVVVAEASLGSSVCALVAAGLGVSLINPLAAVEEVTWSDLIVKPFKPVIPLEVALLFPEHQVQNRLVEAFTVCAEATIRAEVDSLKKKLVAALR